jgi:hypothetical protein
MGRQEFFKRKKLKSDLSSLNPIQNEKRKNNYTKHYVARKKVWQKQ